MHRSWISRSLASALALWLAICLAEPMALHTCAMHGGLAIAQAATVNTHGHSSPAKHGATHAESGHSHQDQSSDSESRQCSCLGDCNAGNSQVGFAAAGISLLTVVMIESSATEVAYASPRLVARRYLLPFSNGPPAVPLARS